MSLEAGTKALLDAGKIRLSTLKHDIIGITYDAGEAAFVGYSYGDSMSSQVGFSTTYTLLCSRAASLCRARFITLA